MRSHPNSAGLVKFQWFSRSKLFHRWHRTVPVFVDFGSAYGFWRILHFDPLTSVGLAGLVDVDGFVSLASGGTDFSANGGPATPLPIRTA